MSGDRCNVPQPYDLGCDYGSLHAFMQKVGVIAIDESNNNVLKIVAGYEFFRIPHSTDGGFPPYHYLSPRRGVKNRPYYRNS